MKDIVFELLLLSELADAEMLDFCWWRPLGGGFIVMGVPTDDDA